MFKVIALVIIIAAVLPLYAQSQVPGDVNCSQTFNGLDITYMISHVRGNYQYDWFDTSHCAWYNGDMNGDGLYHTIADWWEIVFGGMPVGHNLPSPAEFDTLVIESIYASPGDTVELSVYSYSPDALTGIMIHFIYDSAQIYFVGYDTVQYFWGQNYYEEDSRVIAFHMTDTIPKLPGRQYVGEIKVEVSSDIQPGTDIILELVSGTYYPSGFCNLSVPTYFIQPVLVDGIIHVITTGTEQSELPIMSEINLSNYPNPFNASTRIEFVLTKDSPVELIIYDLLGREIDQPVSDYLLSGKHDFAWEGAGHPSGIYFYRLETANGSYSRRMTLLK